ncbi:hypothetical protein FRC06_000071 [Ceratobasidium sp. 370]|nr:hypothetical protein FRC06_000071 [Ceratobasidium sp. 370]
MNNAEYNDFIQRFKAQAQELEDDLSTKTPSGKDVEQISLKVTTLRTSLTEAVTAGILPTYDQRLCEQRVVALEELSSKARSASKPKSKFSFKSTATVRSTASPPTKVSSSAGQSISAVSTASTPHSGASEPSTKSSAAEIILAGHTHRYLTLQDAAGADSLNDTTPAHSLVLTVKGLHNCFVNLASATTKVNAIHVQDLKRTVLYAGDVQGSILLHDCYQCTIIVSSHQFRMHTSDSTHVYLKVPSNPVIEKCANIGFGPFPSMDSTLGSASEPEDVISYTVQDFDWVADSQSPNWHAIGRTGFQIPAFIPENELDIALDTILPRTMSDNQETTA